MRDDYIVTGIDQDGHIIGYVPVSADRAASILLESFLAGKVMLRIDPPDEEDVAISIGPIEVRNTSKGSLNVSLKNKKVKAGKKGKRTVHCKNCGEPGHITKTCPNRNVDAPESTLNSFQTANADRTERVRGMLKAGSPPEEIAKILEMQLGVVNFIRRGMIASGEIKEKHD